MPGKAAKLVISERQQLILLEVSKSRSSPLSVRQRARIILLAFPVPIGEGWFLGQIVSGYDEIKSIVGMSGGPIYGFWKSDDGAWHYHIIALQSCWREDYRVTCGYPLEDFAEFLHERIEEAKAE